MKLMQAICPSRFFVIMLAAIVVSMTSVAAVNFVVDPFDFYGKTSATGINAFKPEIYTRIRLFKAFEVRRVRPEFLILGSSRTHVGLSCRHRAVLALGESCYNLAFDGATTQEMYAYLRHAQAVRPLKHVVLGLDSYHSSTAPSFTRRDFDSLVLYEGAHAWLPRWLSADARLLANLGTLLSSIETMQVQENAEPNWFAADGQRLGEVFFHRPDDHYMQLGPRAYFNEIDRMEVGFQTEDSHGKPAKKPVTTDKDAVKESSLDYVRKIIEFCRRHDIDLRIYLTPAHAHQLEITAAVGGWPSVEQGKRALTRILSEEALRHGGSFPYPLYDFNGYSSVTTEPLPSLGSRDEMKYYWESSHFKEILGKFILDRLFDVHDTDQPAPDDFGVKLSPETIDEWIQITRQAQAEYRVRFADEISELNGIISRAVGSALTEDGKHSNQSQ